MNNQEITQEQQLKNQNEELLQIVDKLTMQLGMKDVRIAQLEVMLNKADKIFEKLQVEQSNLNKEMSE